MSTISLNDLEAMDRFDLIPKEILDWVERAGGNTPLLSTRRLMAKRKNRRLLRTVFGPLFFVSLGGYFGGVWALGAQLMPEFADSNLAWRLSILFFGTLFLIGCAPLSREWDLEEETAPFRRAYGLLRERTKVPFLQLRMMSPDARTELTSTILVKLAGEVLRCEEHEKEMSRDETAPGPQTRTLAENDVRLSRERLHQFHKAAQELGIVTNQNVKVYFDQAEASLKEKDSAAA